MRIKVAPELCNVAAADEIVSEAKGKVPLSVTLAVSRLRQKTGSMRSDADLEALVAKIAAARGVALVMDRKADQFAPG
ncbi:hypothetical protein [Mesorhizobium sophorae]|uniref:hypothetical protein n=1 Tax=Mesorhizobium sophorae TaxID=1300294 RepID=UPI00118044F3|nr:hypothetical protein [Mesorhizobium sophorae]